VDRQVAVILVAAEAVVVIKSIGDPPVVDFGLAKDWVDPPMPAPVAMISSKLLKDKTSNFVLKYENEVSKAYQAWKVAEANLATARDMQHEIEKILK